MLLPRRDEASHPVREYLRAATGKRSQPDAMQLLQHLFVLGAYIASDDAPVTYDVSTLAVALWGGLILLAVVTWFARRRGGRR